MKGRVLVEDKWLDSPKCPQCGGLEWYMTLNETKLGLTDEGLSFCGGPPGCDVSDIECTAAVLSEGPAGPPSAEIRENVWETPCGYRPEPGSHFYRWLQSLVWNALNCSS